MAIYKHTNGNLLKTPAGTLTNSNTCCCGAGYCCIAGDCVDLNPAVGLTCAACNENGGVCHSSSTVTCATQTDCDCSQGSGAAGTGGSFCSPTGYGSSLV